jgi:phosphoribosyl 1,2-cyclic phosphodiesterase
MMLAVGVPLSVTFPGDGLAGGNEMKIRVWGCRGSLPAPSRDTVRYGGNTTCLEIRLNDGTLIVIDAGSGLRNLGRHLLTEQNPTEMYLFLTHAHWDHLMGFPFFEPAYFSRYTIHVRGGPRAKRSLKKYLARQMEAPFFPVPFGVMRAEFDFTSGDPEVNTIGPAEIVPVRLNHPNGGYGFKIAEEGETFVFLPDNELDFAHRDGISREKYVDFCRGANLLMHDAQYTDEEYGSKVGWGHTQVSSAAELSIRAGVERLGLFHHDPDHTDEDLDRLIASCQERIAQADSRVQCFGVREGMDITV